MKTRTEKRNIALTVGLALGLLCRTGLADFDSGSTGADGAFSPTADIELQLPPNGIFNFTSVNIPEGVTVTFRKNSINTPIVMLVSGDFTLAGTIDINGSDAALTSNDSVDSSQPGRGGPGGYDGGRGGLITGSATRVGGSGLGPGGGAGGDFWNATNSAFNQGGGGGGYATSVGQFVQSQRFGIFRTAPGGSAYGSTFLLPLIGGSGGGGGRGGLIISGAGGGGGGGAILVAVTGTADIQATGRITANGGSGGNVVGTGGHSELGGCGGGGSGGAIRIVATIVKGSGQLLAQGSGTGADCVNGASNFPQSGTGGAPGRIRIEGEKMVYGSSATSPPPSIDIVTGPVFIPGQPSLRITNVAGTAAPAAPVGNRDIDLPTTTTNPVTVGFASSGIPLSTTVTLTAKPTLGPAVSAVSSPLAGSVDSATAIASIDLPAGHSVLTATVSYTLTASLGDALGSQFAQGERVERIEVSAGMQGSSNGDVNHGFRQALSNVQSAAADSGRGLIVRRNNDTRDAIVRRDSR